MTKINDYIPDNELEKISISLNDASNKNKNFEILNDEEISYNGKMYDVYKIIKSGDIVNYYCICDDNESIFENAFASYLKDKTDQRTKNSPINNILDNIIKEAITFNNKLDKINETETQIYIPNQNSTYQIIFDIPTPPPKS